MWPHLTVITDGLVITEGAEGGAVEGGVVRRDQT
jgi:hypothetical protein